jgi:hypothetical protein
MAPQYGAHHSLVTAFAEELRNCMVCAPGDRGLGGRVYLPLGPFLLLGAFAARVSVLSAAGASAASTSVASVKLHWPACRYPSPGMLTGSILSAGPRSC